jgi:hypothetical protein
MARKTLLVFMIVAGALLGPFYWFHEKLYSGELALSLPMHPTGDGAWSTAPFKLDPSMQPAGLIFRSQGSFVPRQDENKPPADAYTATLYKDGTASRNLPLPLAVSSVADSNPAFSERLLLLKAVQAGEYRLVIRPEQEPVIALEHPRLEIRAGVQEPDNRLATAGFLMLAFGLVGLFLP